MEDAYLRTSWTSSLTWMSIEGSKSGFSLPAYYSLSVTDSILVYIVAGPVGRLATACVVAYPRCHLLPSCIMSIVITLGEDIVLSGLKAGSVIVPSGSPVRRANGINSRPEFWVRSNEMIWCNPGNRS